MIMKKTIFLFSIFLISTFSAFAQANSFYVCDTNGDDSADGLSEQRPFKTYDHAIWSFNKLEAGGKLLFCRGGKFPATKFARLYNSNCTAEKPCTIGAYGNADLERPVIGADGIHAINFENGGAAKPDGGYNVENLTIMAVSKSGAGIRLFNDVDDVTISNVHIEGFNVGIYAAGNNAPQEGAGSNEAKDRLVVKNSNVINNRKIGFLGSCNDCLIEGNNFEGNGTHPSLDHNIYLTGSNKHKKGITVRNNTLYRSAIVDGKCQGVSLVGHGLLENILIENNIIKEDVGKVSGGCWGISIDPGYNKVDESFKNIVIRNNKLINVGMIGIGCASCEGAIIENNEIIDEGNVLRAGVKVPVREENSIKSSNVYIRNNRVILNNESAVGISIGGENPIVVRGNDISLPSTTTSKTCFERFLANVTTDVSQNICSNHNGVSINEDSLNLDSEVADNIVSPPSQEIDVQDVSLPSIRTQNPVVQEANVTNDTSYSRPTITTTEQVEVIDDNASVSFGEESTVTSTGSSPAGDSERFNSLNDDVSENIANITVSHERQLLITEPIIEVVPENVEINETSSYTRPLGNTNSITVKDVTEAARSDYSEVEVTQCRAYSGRRCLLR